MKKYFSLFMLPCLLAAFICLPGCSKRSVSGTTFAMGSVFTSTVYETGDKADELIKELNEAVAQADRCLSATISGSDINNVNSLGYANVSHYTAETVNNCLGLCKTFNGLVDITIGAVSSLWGFDGETPALPDAAAIEEALATVDCGNVTVDTNGNRISVGHGQKLDLGAFGKGAACEKAVELLRKNKVPAVLVFGGTVAVYGKPPRKSGWTVGVRNPNGTENDYMGIFSLTPDTLGGALYVSTSGKYEKSFTVNDRAYHHILSAETGYPAENDLVSVTVVCPGGLNADALSTALFIAGPGEYASLLLKSFKAGAVFIFENGTVLTEGKYTDSFELTDRSFSLTENTTAADENA